MADDRDARIAWLEAALAASLQREAACIAENALLATDRARALEQQTALADVLRVIASEPTDLHAILTMIAERAARVLGAVDALVDLKEGDDMYWNASGWAPPQLSRRAVAHC